MYELSLRMNDGKFLPGTDKDKPLVKKVKVRKFAFSHVLICGSQNND